MFRDYDPYGRRNGRSQRITNIPGPARQRTIDPVTEINRLRQQLEQAHTEAAEWQQAAEKYHAIAKQQQTELAHMEQRISSLEKDVQRKPVLSNVEADAETQRKEKVAARGFEIEAKKSAPSDANSVRQSADKNEKKGNWEEKYLRLYADYENSKKRLEQRFALESHQNQEKLLRDMLPLADNLERAIQHADSDTDGLAMIQKAFLAALAKHDVAKMDVAERPFDPAIHEAIGMVPHPTAESGTIIDIAENGYTYQDTLLRPAKVLVAQ